MYPTNSNKFYIPFIGILVIISILVVAQFAKFTEGLWWYDMVLHFLGGAWIATLFVYIFKIKSSLFNDRGVFLFNLIVVVSFVALVGVAWEIWEFLVDTLIISGGVYGFQDPLADTIKDLIMDILGGIVMTSYLWKKLFTNKIYTRK